MHPDFEVGNMNLGSATETEWRECKATLEQADASWIQKAIRDALIEEGIDPDHPKSKVKARLGISNGHRLALLQVLGWLPKNFDPVKFQDLHPKSANGFSNMHRIIRKHRPRLRQPVGPEVYDGIQDALNTESMLIMSVIEAAKKLEDHLIAKDKLSNNQ